MPLSRTTELEAVNTMLSVLGEAPINSFGDAQTPDVAQARAILTEISRDVQSRGWHFNTETDVTLTPNSLTNKITIPANCIRIDVEKQNAGSKEIVQRGEFLYDKKDHTFEFVSPLKVHLIYGFDWDELPETARRYIMIRAARILQDRQLGSEKISAFTRTDEQRALVDLESAEGDVGDYSIFDHPDIGETVNRISILTRIST